MKGEEKYLGAAERIKAERDRYRTALEKIANGWSEHRTRGLINHPLGANLAQSIARAALKEEK